jgi:hypothetical protein
LRMKALIRWLRILIYVIYMIVSKLMSQWLRQIRLASVQVSLPYDYSGSVAVSGKVLFDSGASHDFVAPKIAQALNLLPGKQNAFRITTANGVVSGTFPVLELLMKIALHHEGETIHISIRIKLIEFETGEDVVVILAT